MQSGVVEVEYVVYPDGHAADVKPRNTPPTDLFKLVRIWLQTCPFEPAHTPDGTPVPVKMIQPFIFKVR